MKTAAKGDQSLLQDPSALSLGASALYVLVAIASALAFREARTRGDREWQARAFAGLCVLFLLLAASRITGAEEWLRDSLRTWLRSQDRYRERREVQSLAGAAVIVAGAAISSAWFYRTVRNRRSRRGIAAMIALGSGGGMILLIILRMISFHPIDRLLYGFKFNWVIDIGTSLAVLGAALYCIRRPDPRR